MIRIDKLTFRTIIDRAILVAKLSINSADIALNLNLSISTMHQASRSPRKELPIELLSPAGNWDCARAAVANGADAIYFGLEQFNARMRANNFTRENLPTLMTFLHQQGCRGYVTMNVLIFPQEIRQAIAYLDALDEANVDAVIVQDTGLAALICEQKRTGRWKFELHLSTQMTISSPEAVQWADKQFAPDQIILSRELSIKDIADCAKVTDTPIEIFCHGALCVAYSGQCLTSESLGYRSANRGECAQACRLPYKLEVDNRLRDLGERRYLFSPQDLCAIDRIPELIDAGVRCFKIEGRLKSPEYVAATTRSYRNAIDVALGRAPSQPEESEFDLYAMQMSFSRGFTTGWLDGSNHPYLTHGKFGKKRGMLAGRIRSAGRGYIELEHAPALPIAPGDGFVIDAGQDRNEESGGRIWRSEEDGRILHFHGKASNIDWTNIRRGQLVWKTADPALDKMLHASWTSFARHAESPITGGGLKIHFSGEVGKPLKASCRGFTVESEQNLQAAENQALTPDTIESKFSRLGGTGYSLGECSYELPHGLMLPLSQLNQMRRSLVENIPAEEEAIKRNPLILRRVWDDVKVSEAKDSKLYMLCRQEDQAYALAAEAKNLRIDRLYLDFPQINKVEECIAKIREIAPDLSVWVCTLRISKAKEAGILRFLCKSGADGLLVRNLGSLEHKEIKDAGLELAGDFSLNCANPQSAALWKKMGLKSCCISYDLNIGQVEDLLKSGCGDFMEITLHQHMPLFHSEHCVFCAFLSQGKNHLDCERPCEYHRVRVQDRVGAMHYLLSDEGCRNTLFNERPQTAARHISRLRRLGLSQFRVELLLEIPEKAVQLARLYRRLLDGQESADSVLDQVQALDRLGLCKDELS